MGLHIVLSATSGGLLCLAGARTTLRHIKFSEFEIVVATYFYSKLHLKCNMFHKQTVSECYAKVCHVTVLEERKASLE